jgi:hypothetical protein
MYKMHDTLVGALVLIGIVMAVTTGYWLPRVKHLSYLFKDNITIGLIALVVVLLTLYDCKLGVSFAFIVAIVAVNLREGFESFVDIPENNKKDNNESNNTTKPKPTPTSRPKPTPTSRPKPTPTSRPKPTPTSRPKVTEGFQNMGASNDVIADKIEKQMQVPATCNATDFNTYSAGKDYHGFDVAGCRYDLENKTQNLTRYGPPLSWCATYKDSKLPVPFYPLNG